MTPNHLLNILFLILTHHEFLINGWRLYLPELRRELSLNSTEDGISCSLLLWIWAMMLETEASVTRMTEDGETFMKNFRREAIILDSVWLLCEQPSGSKLTLQHIIINNPFFKMIFNTSN